MTTTTQELMVERESMLRELDELRADRDRLEREVERLREAMLEERRWKVDANHRAEAAESRCAELERQMKKLKSYLHLWKETLPAPMSKGYEIGFEKVEELWRILDAEPGGDND